jgi:hypothetical protein
MDIKEKIKHIKYSRLSPEKRDIIDYLKTFRKKSWLGATYYYNGRKIALKIQKKDNKLYINSQQFLNFKMASVLDVISEYFSIWVI